MQSGVDLFAVANVKEANEIREMGSGWPILVLGPLLEEEDEAIVELDIIPSISSVNEVLRFQKLSEKTGKKIRSHIKIDNWNGKNGVWWERAPQVIEEINSSDGIELKGILTHFAEPSNEKFSRLQRDRFQEIIQKCLPTPSPLTSLSMQITPPPRKSWKKTPFLMRYRWTPTIRSDSSHSQCSRPSSR